MTKSLKIIFLLLIFAFFPAVYSANLNENVYMSLDAKTGASFIEKDADKKVFPASTTKIMTCILTLENLKLDEKVTVTPEMINKVPIGSSTMKLVKNEVLTVEDLLYGLMLPSGNDAAIVLAYKISGSIEEFAKLMNEKAKNLGCTSTNFTCPHGFHDDNHYTTARDMSKIMMYAIKNDTFLKLIRTKYYTIKANGYVSYDRKYTNTNTLLENNDYVICGKTGYTDEAGNVFVSYSEKDDYKIINILYDGKKGYYDGDFRFEDTKVVNNYLFSNYSKKTILDDESIKIKYVDKNENFEYFYWNDEALKLITKKSDLKTVLYSILENTSEKIELYMNVLSKGYRLNNYNFTIEQKKYQSINNNYSLLKNIQVFAFSVIDILLLATIFTCIIKIIRIKKSKKRRLNKKYY